MKKISALSLQSMNADELIGFMNDFERIAATALPDSEQHILKLFSAALDAMRQSRSKEEKSYGESIMTADAACGNDWAKINAQLQINIEHYDGDVADAAARVAAVFGRYPDPAHLNCIEEHAAIDGLLTALSEIDADTLRTAMVDGWIARLRKDREVLAEAASEKNRLRALNEIGQNKRLRTNLEEAYRVLSAHIESYALITQEPLYDNLIDRINALAEDKRRSKRAHKMPLKTGRSSSGNFPPAYAE